MSFLKLTVLFIVPLNKSEFPVLPTGSPSAVAGKRGLLGKVFNATVYSMGCEGRRLKVFCQVLRLDSMGAVPAAACAN